MEQLINTGQHEDTYNSAFLHNLASVLINPDAIDLLKRILVKKREKIHARTTLERVREIAKRDGCNNDYLIEFTYALVELVAKMSIGKLEQLVTRLEGVSLNV